MTQTTLREYLRTTEDAISSGRIEEAMANCQNILAYFPEALEVQRLLGEVYLAQGNLAEAQQTFEWILTNDPENVIVYCDRALISERSSDIDTALDCYQQAYELSRGNAHIRQEFNQLSARAGQQEFMFSRAGLARLYMRGDLLAQAIQEWDAVLALSPERLDARLGLMETYWREGLHDKAEQIATQLLEEIPTCLKALLYLAHITSISNIARAKSLLSRAEVLDPEMRMAQELFADLAASQPGDPFLELIKKEPILLENGTPLHHQPTLAPDSPIQHPLSPPEQDVATSLYGEWDTVNTWDKQTSLVTPLSPLPPAPIGVNGNANEEKSLSQVQDQAELDMSVWQMQEEELPSSPSEDQPWYESEQYALTNAESVQNWESLATPPANTWHLEAQDEEQPAPPAWLGTLTRSEKLRAVQPPPVVPTQPEVQPTQLQAHPTFSTAQQMPVQEEETPFFFPSDNEENEGEMGWPEWLKSLGAETLEPEQATPSAPLAEIDATPFKASPQTHTEEHTSEQNQHDWMQQLSGTQVSLDQPAMPDWMQQFSTPASSPNQPAMPDWMQQFSSAEDMPHQPPAEPAPIAEEEQRYIASLEELEKSFQSQGFAPLVPGSLSSIAQAQANVSEPVQPQVQEQPSLSSALAQLGNFSQPSGTSPSPGDPWWNSMLEQASEQPMPTTLPLSGEQEQVNSFATLSTHAHQEAPAQMPTLPATPTPLATPFQSASGIPTPPLTPTYRSDALLDNDLETTMKRPAIKLQPMQTGDRPYPNGKGHSGERPAIEHGDDGNLSNHERLVRAYQYQLSGGYEEAMQDYRVIIRNAPELLEDVISNLRALLKLNPRFSLGYRVLGDAYMRKGEYLQAMESYNKALTMAKKARG
ncbi:MAG TPA: tetratricopeptide repeat protein [Ktedonobacteraceae bacterium]|nr:tetratricopeptide repeat protein [Ktedonobacteraceae bacterium]